MKTTVTRSVNYSGIVLDTVDHEKLVELLYNQFDESVIRGWKVYADHMTLNLGKLSTVFGKVGDRVKLQCKYIGKTDMAIAVLVEAVPYFMQADLDAINRVKVPHITLAVNTALGGKPRMSLDIDNWIELKDGIYVNGTIKEVEQT